MAQIVDKAKRTRGTNFTKEEELLLLSEIEKIKSVIECKLTDKVSSTKKNAAWKKVCDAFNAKNKCNRTVDQMKVKYDNLKCKARKSVAKNGAYIAGTGGGPSGTSETDPILEAVLRILNKSTVVRLTNQFDCDGSSVKKDNNQEKKEGNETIISEVEEVDASGSGLKDPVTSLNCETETSYSANTGKPELIKNIEQRQSITTKVPNGKSNNTETGVNWTKCTPKHLKKPTSKKLRHAVSLTIKEQYYKKKMELTQEKINIRKLQQEIMLRNQEHQIEEHNKKMRLLDIEIELKQKTLQF